MSWVVAVDTEVVTERKGVAAPWLVLIMIPRAGKPVDLTHGRKTHGLFHG